MGRLVTFTVLGNEPESFSVSAALVAGDGVETSVELREPGGRCVGIGLACDHGSWLEAWIENGSTKNPFGSWIGDVRIALEGQPDPGFRKGVRMYDGTAWPELFGTPKPSANPRRVEIARRLFLSRLPDPKSMPLTLARKPLASAVSFDPEAWITPNADPCPDRNAAGSAADVGCVPELSGLGLLLQELGDEAGALAMAVESSLFTFQQARRPVHFSEPNTPAQWRAATRPLACVGEYGPSGLWGAKDLMGRELLPASHRFRSPKWDGVELEHVTVAEVVGFHLLTGSRFALRHAERVAEGHLTHPHMKGAKRAHSPRVWGWGAMMLAQVAAVTEDEQRKLDLRAALDRLCDGYLAAKRDAPTVSALELPADRRHLYPTVAELKDYAAWKGLGWPDLLPWWEAAVARLDGARQKWNSRPPGLAEKQAKALLDELKDADFDAREAVVEWWRTTAGQKAKDEVLSMFSFQTVWQSATILLAWAAGRDSLGELPKLDAVGRHALASILLQGRRSVPGSTFVECFAALVPGRLADYDEGTSFVGTVEWTAGGVAAALRFLTAGERAVAEPAARSVCERAPSRDKTKVGWWRWAADASVQLGT